MEPYIINWWAYTQKKHGGHSALSNKFEEIVVRALDKLTDWKVPFDGYDIRCLVQSYFTSIDQQSKQFKDNKWKIWINVTKSSILYVLDSERILDMSLNCFIRIYQWCCFNRMSVRTKQMSQRIFDKIFSRRQHSFFEYFLSISSTISQIFLV